MERALGAQLVEDRLSELLVAIDEVACPLAPIALAVEPDLGHVTQLGQAFDRNDERIPFERASGRDHLVDQRTIVVTEAAPEDKVLGAFDGSCRIDLDAVEVPRHLDDAVLGGR